MDGERLQLLPILSMMIMSKLIVLGRIVVLLQLIYSFGEGQIEVERIGQHMRNIRAINFDGHDVPEGIDAYLKNQIKFINKMIGIL